MEPLARYQRRIILALLLVIFIGLTLKVVDRQRRAVGFDVRGFLDGYKYTTGIDSAGKTVALSTNVYGESKADSVLETDLKLESMKININTADIIELQKLPGIGPVLARRIVDYRDSAGTFKKVEDLLEIKGIGEKKLAKMKEYLDFENPSN